MSLQKASVRASTVRFTGREGAITISRSLSRTPGGGEGRGDVTVSLAGRRPEELLPRASAELALDLGRLDHLVVDARQAEGDGAGWAGAEWASRWADAHRDRAVRVTFLAASAA